MSKITLLSLPNEMLLRVRSHLHSLQDHVYFARTCKTAHGLYNEDFFKFAVRSAGWSLIAGAQVDATTWQKLASTLVANARLFREYGDVSRWTQQEAIFEGQLVKVLDSAAVERGKIHLSIEILDASFRVTDVHTPGCFVMYNYRIAAPDSSQGQADREPKLVKVLDHPYLANRFLTYPRVSHIELQDEEYCFQSSANNGEGVTISDAYTEMTAALNRRMRPEDWFDGRHTISEGLWREQAGSCKLQAAWGS